MRSRNRTAKLCAAILTVVMLLTSVAQFVFADEYPPREGDFTENPREGNVIMGIEGEFVTITEEEKAILLDRVNEIRKEACDEGVPSPSDRSVALTSADYVPIKWSRLIELIAAMRAVESSVAIAHQRLAVNTSVFTITARPQTPKISPGTIIRRRSTPFWPASSSGMTRKTTGSTARRAPSPATTLP